MNMDATQAHWRGQWQATAGVLSAMRMDEPETPWGDEMAEAVFAVLSEASADPDEDEDEDEDDEDDDLDDLEDEDDDEEIEEEIEEEMEEEMEEENEEGGSARGASEEQVAQRIRNEGVPVGDHGILENEEQVAQRIRNEGLQVGEQSSTTTPGTRKRKGK